MINSKYIVYVVYVVYLVHLVHLVHLTLKYLYKSQLIYNNCEVNMHKMHKMHTLHGVHLVHLDVQLAFYQLTASLYAGYVSFLYNLITKFLAVLRVKNVYRGTQKADKWLRDNCAKNTYRNHRIENHQKSLKNRQLQIANDLKRRFKNADNLSLV